MYISIITIARNLLYHNKTKQPEYRNANLDSYPDNHTRFYPQYRKPIVECRTNKNFTANITIRLHQNIPSFQRIRIYARALLTRRNTANTPDKTGKDERSFAKRLRRPIHHPEQIRSKNTSERKRNMESHLRSGIITSADYPINKADIINTTFRHL